MCYLCGTDEERKKGKEHARWFANELQTMAKMQRELADGVRQPHSADMRPVTLLAKSTIRELVSEYV